MAPTLEAMREALAANLSAIPDVQVSARLLASPTPPTLQVLGGKTIFDQAMGRGLDEWTFTVQAFVGNVDAIGSSLRLDLFRDPRSDTSVKKAIEKPDGPNGVEATLGGLVASVQVTEMSEERIYQVGNREVLGCDFTVVVKAPGK